MRAMTLVEGLRVLGAAALMVFPARRRLREIEAENRELRGLRDRVETSAGYLASCVERSRTYS